MSSLTMVRQQSTTGPVHGPAAEHYRSSSWSGSRALQVQFMVRQQSTTGPVHGPTAERYRSSSWSDSRALQVQFMVRQQSTTGPDGRAVRRRPCCATLVEECLTKGLKPSVAECLTSRDAGGPSRGTGSGVRGRQGGRPGQGCVCVGDGGGEGGPALRDIPASNRSAESDSKNTTPELRKENNKRA